MGHEKTEAQPKTHMGGKYFRGSKLNMGVEI